MASRHNFKVYQPPLAAVSLLAAAVGGPTGCSGDGMEHDDSSDHHAEPPPTEPSAKENSDSSDRSEREDPGDQGTATATGECDYNWAPELDKPDQEDGEVLSAVGILEQQVGNEFKPICTGSLIGTKKVLTACHCKKAMIDTDNTVWFRRRSDRLKVGKQGASCDPSRREGGFNHVGSDVAIMFLEKGTNEPAIPLEARKLTEDEITEGESLTAVGYFFQRNGKTENEPDGQVASLVLRATEGRFLKKAFKTPENFNNCLAEYWKEDTATNLRLEEITWEFNRDGIDWIDNEFNATTNGHDGNKSTTDVTHTIDSYGIFNMSLLENYQAWFDGGLDGAQPCKGDSGAPLVRRTDAGFAVYGVVSGSINLDVSEPRCAFGAVYAIFTEETLTWLKGLRDPREWPEFEPERTTPQPGIWTAAANAQVDRPLTSAGAP
ncbi:trypsin-like serine protease [Sorangium cellulosum]|uniref:trypsin-like serine protease n=1 Tax=Sorangium cellulosum TaxID=56 RepID=UPI003D9A3119